MLRAGGASCACRPPSSCPATSCCCSPATRCRPTCASSQARDLQRRRVGADRRVGAGGESTPTPLPRDTVARRPHEHGLRLARSSPTAAAPASSWPPATAPRSGRISRLIAEAARPRDAADAQDRAVQPAAALVVILGLAALTFAVGAAARRGARRDVHGRRRAGRGRDPRGPAGGRHHHARHRRVAAWPGGAPSSASCRPSRRSAAPRSSAPTRPARSRENQMTVQRDRRRRRCVLEVTRRRV